MRLTEAKKVFPDRERTHSMNQASRVSQCVADIGRSLLGGAYQPGQVSILPHRSCFSSQLSRFSSI